MNFNFNLKELGIGGAGIVLIIVGIALATTGLPSWGAFCITLGIATLAYGGATAESDTNGAGQRVAGIIAIVFFIISIVVLLASLRL